MTYITTDLIRFHRLLDGLGKRPEAKLEIGADISRSLIRDIKKGYVPSPPIRQKVAAFFRVKEDHIWPLQTEEGQAA